MTLDEIIQMANEAGIEFQRNTGITGRVRITTCGSQAVEKIGLLIDLAAAAERELCAKVLDQELSQWIDKTDDGAVAVKSCADVIRARGKA